MLSLFTKLKIMKSIQKYFSFICARLLMDQSLSEEQESIASASTLIQATIFFKVTMASAQAVITLR